MRALTLAVLLAAPLAAQPGSFTADTTGLHPALVPFAGLVGDWAGRAEQRTATGPVTVHQTERVRVGLGGAVLTVEGTGRRLRDDGQPGEIAFHAFGVFSVDGETGEVWLDTWTRDHQHVRLQPEPVENGFDWGFEVPDGGPVVRYEMRFDDQGRWVETGQVRLPTGQTFDTFEMTLDRVE